MVVILCFMGILISKSRFVIHQEVPSLGQTTISLCTVLYLKEELFTIYLPLNYFAQCAHNT